MNPSIPLLRAFIYKKMSGIEYSSFKICICTRAPYAKIDSIIMSDTKSYLHALHPTTPLLKQKPWRTADNQFLALTYLQVNPTKQPAHRPAGAPHAAHGRITLRGEQVGRRRRCRDPGPSLGFWGAQCKIKNGFLLLSWVRRFFFSNLEAGP
jgi:hypothetical protein